MEDCIFCKIVAGEIPSKKRYEDEDMIIFEDIAPQAKIHLLMIPKDHFANVKELDNKRAELLGKCLMKLGTLTAELGLDGGFRLVINQGDDACQTVKHLHVHILAGEKLSEKMA